MASETRTAAESIRKSAREVMQAYRAGRSLDGDDVGNVAYDLEDAAAENTRLAAELAEMRRLYADMTLERGRFRGELEEVRAKVERYQRLVVDADTVAYRDEANQVGLYDAEDNDGERYQSQWAADLIAEARRAIATPPAEGGGDGG